MTDDKDRRLLTTVLERVYRPEIMEEDFSLSASGTYRIPGAEGLEDMRNYVAQLPLMAAPEAFGLHENADITKDLQMTDLMLQTLLDAGGGAGGGEGGKGGQVGACEGARDAAGACWQSPQRLATCISTHCRFPCLPVALATLSAPFYPALQFSHICAHMRTCQLAPSSPPPFAGGDGGSHGPRDPEPPAAQL